jgi:hypothetical protein
MPNATPELIAVLDSIIAGAEQPSAAAAS